MAALAAAALLGCGTTSGATKPAVSKPVPAAPGPRATTGPKPSGTEPEMPRLSARAERLFQEAVEAPEEQKKLKVPTDWEALERKWRAVLEAEEVPEAEFNLGVVLEHLNRPAEARAAYARAVEEKPSLHQAALNLAILSEPEDPHAAAAAYADLLRRYPDDAGARVRLAALYRASGQLDEAWRLSREALMNDPHALGAYKVMIRVALDRGNTDLAELIALRSQKLTDADPEIAFFMGQIRAKQDDEPGATAQYKRALALKEDFLPPRYELLRVALKKQLWESVAEQGKVLLRFAPSDPRIHLALGIAYRYLNQGDKAMEEYGEADRLAAGKLPEVHLARGALYMKVKNVCEPAIAEFKQYVNLAPGLAANAPVFQLQRECEQIVITNQKAAESARRMKEEDERKKAEEDAKKAKDGAAPEGKGAELQPKPVPAAAGDTKPAEAKPSGTRSVPGKPGKPAKAGKPAEPKVPPAPAAEPTKPPPEPEPADPG